MEAEEVGDLDENKVLVEGDAWGVPAKAGEQPSPDPVEQDPCGGGFEGEGDVFERGNGGGSGFWGAMSHEPCPQGGVEGEVTRQQQGKTEENGVFEEFGERRQPREGGGEKHQAGEVAHGGGHPARRVGGECPECPEQRQQSDPGQVAAVPRSEAQCEESAGESGCGPREGLRRVEAAEAREVHGWRVAGREALK